MNTFGENAQNAGNASGIGKIKKMDKEKQIKSSKLGKNKLDGSKLSGSKLSGSKLSGSYMDLYNSKVEFYKNKANKMKNLGGDKENVNLSNMNFNKKGVSQVLKQKMKPASYKLKSQGLKIPSMYQDNKKKGLKVKDKDTEIYYGHKWQNTLEKPLNISYTKELQKLKVGELYTHQRAKTVTNKKDLQKDLLNRQDENEKITSEVFSSIRILEAKGDKNRKSVIKSKIDTGKGPWQKGVDARLKLYSSKLNVKQSNVKHYDTNQLLKSGLGKSQFKDISNLVNTGLTKLQKEQVKKALLKKEQLKHKQKQEVIESIDVGGAKEDVFDTLKKTWKMLKPKKSKITTKVGKVSKVGKSKTRKLKSNKLKIKKKKFDTVKNKKTIGKKINKVNKVNKSKEVGKQKMKEMPNMDTFGTVKQTGSKVKSKFSEAKGKAKGKKVIKKTTGKKLLKIKKIDLGKVKSKIDTGLKTKQYAKRVSKKILKTGAKKKVLKKVLKQKDLHTGLKKAVEKGLKKVAKKGLNTKSKDKFKIKVNKFKLDAKKETMKEKLKAEVKLVKGHNYDIIVRGEEKFLRSKGREKIKNRKLDELKEVEKFEKVGQLWQESNNQFNILNISFLSSDQNIEIDDQVGNKQLDFDQFDQVEGLQRQDIGHQVDNLDYSDFDKLNTGFLGVGEFNDTMQSGVNELLSAQNIDGGNVKILQPKYYESTNLKEELEGGFVEGEHLNVNWSDSVVSDDAFASQANQIKLNTSQGSFNEEIMQEVLQEVFRRSEEKVWKNQQGIEPEEVEYRIVNGKNQLTSEIITKQNAGQNLGFFVLEKPVAEKKLEPSVTGGYTYSRSSGSSSSIKLLDRLSAEMFQEQEFDSSTRELDKSKVNIDKFLGESFEEKEVSYEVNEVGALVAQGIKDIGQRLLEKARKDGAQNNLVDKKSNKGRFDAMNEQMSLNKFKSGSDKSIKDSSASGFFVFDVSNSRNFNVLKESALKESKNDSHMEYRSFEGLRQVGSKMVVHGENYLKQEDSGQEVQGVEDISNSVSSSVYGDKSSVWDGKFDSNSVENNDPKDFIALYDQNHILDKLTQGTQGIQSEKYVNEAKKGLDNRQIESDKRVRKDIEYVEYRGLSLEEQINISNKQLEGDIKQKFMQLQKDIKEKLEMKIESDRWTFGEGEGVALGILSNNSLENDNKEFRLDNMPEGFKVVIKDINHESEQHEEQNIFLKSFSTLEKAEKFGTLEKAEKREWSVVRDQFSPNKSQGDCSKETNLLDSKVEDESVDFNDLEKAVQGFESKQEAEVVEGASNEDENGFYELLQPKIDQIDEDSEAQSLMDLGSDRSIKFDGIGVRETRVSNSDSKRDSVNMTPDSSMRHFGLIGDKKFLVSDILGITPPTSQRGSMQNLSLNKLGSPTNQSFNGVGQSQRVFRAVVSPTNKQSSVKHLNSFKSIKYIPTLEELEQKKLLDFKISAVAEVNEENYDSGEGVENSGVENSGVENSGVEKIQNQLAKRQIVQFVEGLMEYDKVAKSKELQEFVIAYNHNLEQAKLKRKQLEQESLNKLQNVVDRVTKERMQMFMESLKQLAENRKVQDTYIDYIDNINMLMNRLDALPLVEEILKVYEKYQNLSGSLEYLKENVIDLQDQSYVNQRDGLQVKVEQSKKKLQEFFRSEEIASLIQDDVSLSAKVQNLKEIYDSGKAILEELNIKRKDIFVIRDFIKMKYVELQQSVSEEKIKSVLRKGDGLYIEFEQEETGKEQKKQFVDKYISLLSKGKLQVEFGINSIVLAPCHTNNDIKKEFGGMLQDNGLHVSEVQTYSGRSIEGYNGDGGITERGLGELERQMHMLLKNAEGEELGHQAEVVLESPADQYDEEYDEEYDMLKVVGQAPDMREMNGEVNNDLNGGMNEWGV